jgi:hypothetical protein
MKSEKKKNVQTFEWGDVGIWGRYRPRITIPVCHGPGHLVMFLECVQADVSGRQRIWRMRFWDLEWMEASIEWGVPGV